MVLCAGTVCRVLCSLCSILSAVCRVISAGCRLLSAVCCVQGPCVGCCVLCVGCCVLWVCSAGGRAQLFSLGKGVGARARPAGGFLTPVLSARTYHRSTHRRHLLIQKTPPPSSGKCGGAPLTIARAGSPSPWARPTKEHTQLALLHGARRRKAGNTTVICKAEIDTQKRLSAVGGPQGHRGWRAFCWRGHSKAAEWTKGRLNCLSAICMIFL